MSRHLASLPAGVSVFVDANIFIYHLLDLKPTCTEFFRRVRQRDIRAYSSEVVLSEVMHKLMLSEIGERHSTTMGGALRILRNHPELISSLVKLSGIIQQIKKWRIRRVSLNWDGLQLAAELSQRYHLMTIDGFIVATMQTHEITHLASNDTDFLSVPNMTLWQP